MISSEMYDLVFPTYVTPVEQDMNCESLITTGQGGRTN